MQPMHTPRQSDPSDSIFSRLPPQLLALVLALDPAERLGSMARVCSAWQAAAVMATNRIRAVGRQDSWLGSDSTKALSGWLQVNAATACLDSLTVRCGGRYTEPLTLLVQQLASLRSLDLENLTVTVQGQADTQAADVPPELSAITHLRLWDCGVRLGTLPAFTHLQHMVLSSSGLPSSRSLEVSGLVHLTHLHLSGCYARDSMMGSVGALTSLQELLVQGDLYTAASFAALPVSLTKLLVGGDWCHYLNDYGVDNETPPPVELSVASTPAVAALTGLRWLEVDRAGGFSAALLRDMSSLQYLAVRGTSLLAEVEREEGESDNEEDYTHMLGLTVLSSLTQLQHLELPQTPDHLTVELTEADVAALTASIQLTCLIIDGGLVPQEQYCYMWPAEEVGVQIKLPKLKELRATMGMLGIADDAAAMVGCCPKLERLDLGTAMPDEPVFEYFDSTWEPHIDSRAACSVAHLCKLESLTRLVINVHEEDCSDVFWHGLAELDRLRELHINELSFAHFGGVVALAKCTALTHLSINRLEEDSFPTPSPHGKHIPYFAIKTLEGHRPDIWSRLPHKALTAAVDHYKNAPEFGWEHPEDGLLSMARAVATHAVVLQRETTELRD